MDKKGRLGDILLDNAVFLILLIIFIAGMFFFVSGRTNNAHVWEDYYAKEIVKVIDMSEPGDYIELDIHRATEIAQGNGVSDLTEGLFRFNNEENSVCVKLGKGQATCFNYFKEVDVMGDYTELAAPGSNKNLLHFRIMEVKNE